MAGILFINFISLFHFENIKAAAEEKQRKVSAEILLEEQIKYYHLLEDRQQEMDAHWHDIQKHIHVMEEMLSEGYKENSEKYLTELKQRIHGSPAVVHTPHPIISAVLTNGLWRAKQRNITVQMDVRLSHEIKVSPIDLCILIGNAFDNAINACELLPEGIDRTITVAIYQEGESLLIQLNNSYDPKTKTPTEKKSYGLGLKNIETVVNRNGGSLAIDPGSNTFSISIILHAPTVDCL
jgi:sensor histidine kinase regulating citrate/malate metabolism